nr:MAG: RNA-dependent RNA-polymerase [Picobirnavirus sp.]
MPKINVTSSMEDYFDLNHVIRSEKPNGKDITTDVALRTFFGRAVHGQETIYTAPFASEQSTSELLKDWNRTLVSVKRMWPSLYDFEMDLMAKVGPLSVAKPLRERMSDIGDYFSGILLPRRPIEPWAVWDVLHEWQQAAGLRIRSEAETQKRMKMSSNSGAPFFDKRRNVVERTGYDIGFSDSSRYPGAVWTRLNTFENLNCATIGWRGQEGGIKIDDVKQRVVWMFPYAINLVELGVYQPLIEAAQKFNLVPPWVSMEQVDKHITKLFDTKGSNDVIVCTDFTKFDQHFNRTLQDAAEESIDYLFTGDSSLQFWLNKVFPIKYNIPMMYNYGRLWIGEHGMASGSGGTNADETLAHRALQYEVAGLHDANLNPNSMCLGDDGVLTYPGITSEDVTRSYSSHGLEMNKAKQYESKTDCIFLRRWHHQDYRIAGECAGVYSTMRALGRLRYLERWMNPNVWNERTVALRQLSIIENCKNHPLREQFAEFCMKRDKFRLGKDIPGFLDNIKQIAQESIDVMPDFLGYTKSLQSRDNPAEGIDSWWIVKYLKSV